MDQPGSRPRPRPRPRPVVLIAALVAALAAALVGFASPASARTPSCAVAWGSLPEHGASTHPGGFLTGVRAGQQACSDRLVIDIAGPTSFDAWHVQYVDRVYHDPTGAPVPLRGGAFLLISVQAPDHTPEGAFTYRPPNRSELVDVSGYPAFRQVAWAGEFESVSSIAVGLRARLPYRVTTLPGIPGSAYGTRVVIDVARSW